MKTLRNILLASALFGLLLSTLGMVGCPQPIKPPTPGPTPALDAGPAQDAPFVSTDARPLLPDKFLSATVDCGTASVKSWLSGARPPVETCLELAQLVDARQCLLKMLTTWPTDAVVCAVRSVGVSAYTASAAGVATSNLLANAAMSRAFIVAEKFSIRN